MEAQTASVPSLFAGVTQRVDAQPLDIAIRELFDALDSHTQSLVRLVWESEVPIDEAAIKLDIKSSDARSLLQDFVRKLDNHVRETLSGLKGVAPL